MNEKIIKGFENYIIDNSGIVFNLEKQKIVESIYKAGVEGVVLKSDNGGFSFISIVDLLKDNFTGEDVDYLFNKAKKRKVRKDFMVVIDDIDNSYNDDDDDLIPELDTKKENSIKLKHSKAIVKNVEVFSKNLITNEIRHHSSVEKASKDLKLFSSGILRHLNNTKTITPYKQYFFKYKNDTTPWIELLDDQIELLNKANSMGFWRYNKQYGYRLIFANGDKHLCLTLDKLAELTGISKSHISRCFACNENKFIYKNFTIEII